MLVETAALYEPSTEGGASERAIKQRWWRQLFEAIGDRPAIGAISWLELARPEEEIDGQVADWRVTHRPALATALGSDLEASGIATGPVTRLVEPSEPAVHEAGDESAGEGASATGGSDPETQVVTIGPLTPGWIVFIVVSLAAVYSAVRSLFPRTCAAVKGQRSPRT